MDEIELIQKLSRDLPKTAEVITGAGDDCAVLDVGIPGYYQLFKTDAVVEGVHFDSSASPEKVGYKALARALSDIAAMGGRAGSAIVTLGLPQAFDSAYIESVYSGLRRVAESVKVAIVGGETVRNPERLLLSVALIGSVPQGKCVLRSGAQPGDAIFVSGELGGSIEGKHLEFKPRLEEGEWLTEHFGIHAMIDLSDGLAGDLRHLTRAGGVGAELLTNAIPISPAARRLAQGESAKKTPLLAALTDGEDYELLFTVDKRDAVGLLDAWKEAFPQVPLRCVGKVISEREIRLRDREGIRPLAWHGYRHFS